MEDMQQEEQGNCTCNYVKVGIICALLSIFCGFSINVSGYGWHDALLIPKFLLAMAFGILGVLTTILNIKKLPKEMMLLTLIVSGVSILYTFVAFIIGLVHWID